MKSRLISHRKLLDSECVNILFSGSSSRRTHIITLVRVCVDSGTGNLQIFWNGFKMQDIANRRRLEWQMIRKDFGSESRIAQNSKQIKLDKLDLLSRMEWSIILSSKAAAHQLTENARSSSAVSIWIDPIGRTWIAYSHFHKIEAGPALVYSFFIHFERVVYCVIHASCYIHFSIWFVRQLSQPIV